MTRECLVCGTTSTSAALLCPKCGAPLPEVDTTIGKQPTKVGVRRRSRGRGKYLMVGIVGVLAISLVAIAVLWTANGAASPEDTLARLPSNMSAVGAVSIEQLWKHEALKSIWENPVAAQYLGQVETFSGVNIRALTTALAGSRMTDAGLEGLYVVNGTFEPEKLGTLIRTICPDDIVISGHRLSLCDLPNILSTPMLDQTAAQHTDTADNNGSVDNHTASPSTSPLSPVAVGAWDESHFVAGTPALIEAYFTGGNQVGENSKLASLLANVDPAAFAWGAADVDRIYGKLKTRLPGLESIPALKESAVVFELLLRDALELRAECILANSEAANSLKALTSIALQGAISSANQHLAVTGRADLLSGTVTTSENRLKIHMRLIIPSVPF